MAVDPYEIAVSAQETCLEACRAFEADPSPDMEPRDTREWWAESFSKFPDKLAARIRERLEAACPSPSGCLNLGSGTKTPAEPQRIYWRQRRLKVYQLVARGLSGKLPTKRSVVRHLCHNRLCINPKHLTIGTQAQNLLDQRFRRAADWPHL